MASASGSRRSWQRPGSASCCCRRAVAGVGEALVRHWPILAAGAIAVLAAAEPGSDLAAPAKRIGQRLLQWLPRPRLPEPTLLHAMAARSGELAERLETGLVRWSIDGTELFALAFLTIQALMS